ncbi:STYKc [Musa troglodytarum]|uniref:non-specific serine/threonine protein kinase n=1 Tax=Musa troglodytarum TaxID=320322 RepID=A0A9E7KSB3_9LILI|nr:STYKc [Musa troglodytarum]
MLPPSFFLLLLLLVAISSPSIAGSLSTVAISRISNVIVVCAIVRSNANGGYDLSCTSLPTGRRRIYRSGAISSSAIAGGDGFLCLLSLSTDVSTMVWWDLYQESYYGWSPDYRMVYSGPPLADLSAGDTHACGIRGGSLPRPTCWRWNQLTFPDGVYFSDIAVGGDFVCGLLLSGEIRCFGYDTGVVGQEPPGAYSTVAAGTWHACAVSGDGKLVCWGEGKPEVGVIPFEISSLALGENKTCALGCHGGVMCWGENSSLPPSLANTEFVAILAKGSTICGILRINYSLACWGSAVFCHKPAVFERVLPGTCMPTSSCRCGPLEGSGQLCANGRVVCSLCELGREASSPRAPLPPPPPPASPNAAATPRRRKTVFVVIGSVGFAIGLVTLILCLLYFARCNGRKHDSGAARRPLAPGLPSALARPHCSGGLHAPIEWRFSSLFGRGYSAMVEEFPLSVLLAATDNFAESQKVGSGSFGSVYRATLDDGRVFAMPHIAADDVHRVLDPRLPPPKPSEIEAVTYVGYLAIDCVSPEGRERPTMTEVVDGLERALDACEPPSASLSRSTTKEVVVHFQAQPSHSANEFLEESCVPLRSDHDHAMLARLNGLKIGKTAKKSWRQTEQVMEIAKVVSLRSHPQPCPHPWQTKAKRSGGVSAATSGAVSVKPVSKGCQKCGGKGAIECPGCKDLVSRAAPAVAKEDSLQNKEEKDEETTPESMRWAAPTTPWEPPNGYIIDSPRMWKDFQTQFSTRSSSSHNCSK